MITLAEEFLLLRTIAHTQDYGRVINECAVLETWFEIIRHYPIMREWVSLNKTVPIEVLETLTYDDSPTIRGSIARKNKITREIFEVLADDKDASVRNRLVYNKNILKDLLLKLTNND
ncbi:hypothetical protein IEE84_09415 [Psychrobacter sp. 28M-43]|uniref:hypothetical protein n=1 Tax=Psychrobacter sp. 28M-43 TaxID=2772254 RepID=UPI00168D1FB9|nr:hypothetical protein [Psychrobacter sp. 28M-43]QOD12109.1 hypothetical protein IEE84_09415 [Psychrobacter sp. 28M-43]